MGFGLGRRKIRSGLLRFLRLDNYLPPKLLSPSSNVRFLIPFGCFGIGTITYLGLIHRVRLDYGHLNFIPGFQIYLLPYRVFLGRSVESRDGKVEHTATIMTDIIYKSCKRAVLSHSCYTDLLAVQINSESDHGIIVSFPLPCSPASIRANGGTGAGRAVGYFDFFVTGCSELPRFLCSKMYALDIEVHHKRLPGELVGNSLE
jgi:hypothetical protein